MTKYFFLLLAVVLVAGGFFVFNESNQEKESSDRAEEKDVMLDNNTISQEETNEEDKTEEILPSDETELITYEYSGALRDVTADWVSQLRGIDTKGLANGSAQMTFQNGTFYLSALIANLPDPQEDDFYEGWLVRNEPFDFISTGILVKEEDGVYTNVFESDQDLTTYTQYVLTIEPNDSDPAPAGHVVEGELVQR
ncbi:MAG: anti-sigma factor [Candidatus Dojkabacteria bacterium]|nr:anti-sigma factor [Candidatus Dojkabacteria bacterium]MDQ7021816.1 anti-sigma factor [Candidatus Dojkabacteria bacterium]